MKNFIIYLINLMYPPKCVLCQKILSDNQIDLCSDCWENGPVFVVSKKKIPNVKNWTALWIYKDNARKSLLNYKFRYRRNFSNSYGRLLAMKILTASNGQEYDLVTWAPPSIRRLFKRGFDHSRKIAYAVSKELDIPLVRTLYKASHNKSQATLESASQRKANVLGVYKPYKPEQFAGKRIILIDDIVTTGSTAGECAKTLMIYGAKDVFLAAVASTEHSKLKN